MVYSFSFVILLCLEYGRCNLQKRLILDSIDSQQLFLDIQSLKASVADLQGKLSEQERTIRKLSISSGLGTVYTRWGRKDCQGNGTVLIYNGFAGGGLYSHYGSAAEYMCLPHDPIFVPGKQAQTAKFGAYIYGAEYEDNVFGANLYNQDVPCAVCMSSYASNVLLVPAKTSCHTGWNLEYSGLLASSAYNLEAAGQFVCVDEDPSVLEGGSGNMDGKLFYPVHAQCGSLKCPPYRNDELLTCAVCSK